LAKHNFEHVTPELRDDILAFYHDQSAPIATKKKSAAWQKTQEEVEKLKAFVPSEAPAIQESTIPESPKASVDDNVSASTDLF
jgi:hypothetical protein